MKKDCLVDCSLALGFQSTTQHAGWKVIKIYSLRMNKNTFCTHSTLWSTNHLYQMSYSWDHMIKISLCYSTVGNNDPILSQFCPCHDSICKIVTVLDNSNVDYNKLNFNTISIMSWNTLFEVGSWMVDTQIARFMRPTWGPPGTCRPQLGPMLAHEPCYEGRVTPRSATVTVNSHHVTNIHIGRQLCNPNFGITIFRLPTYSISQIAKFTGPTCGPPGSCQPQMDPIWASWSLLSGLARHYVKRNPTKTNLIVAYFASRCINLLETVKPAAF